MNDTRELIASTIEQESNQMLSSPSLETIGSDMFTYKDTVIPDIEPPNSSWIRRFPPDKKKGLFRSLYKWYWPTDISKGAKSEASLLSLGGIHIQPVEVNVNEMESDNPDQHKFMHTLILSKPKTYKEPKPTKDVVICHGFGAGLGFFYRNYAHIFQLPSVNRVFAPDWLGMGRSSRPNFPKFTHHPKWQHQEAINFFIESFELWRSRQLPPLSRFTLIGHSLGGYLAALYALKYPQYIEKLVLLSPIGIPLIPQFELESSKDDLLAVTGHKIPAWIAHLWSRNITPQWLIRMAGPWGPQIVQRYAEQRFHMLPQTHLKHFKDYLYHISADTASGEYALAAILSPGAWAREPLFNKLSDLTMPTTFIFGDRDWMDYRHAQDALPTMKVPCRVLRISNAGHYLFVDNSEEFNKIIEMEITK